MSSDSLEEALLEHEMGQNGHDSGRNNESIPSLGGADWDPEALLSSMDEEIGDLDVGINLGPEEPATETPKPVKPKRKRKKQLNSNRARDERRFEVVRLRREVEDLQLTLKQLQYIRDQQRQHSGQHTTAVQEQETVEDDTEVPAVWQEICARQLNRRVKAERENALLKQQWEEEKRLVKSIEKMLFKRMALRDMAGPEASKHTRRTSSRRNTSSASLPSSSTSFRPVSRSRTARWKPCSQPTAQCRRTW